VLMLICVQSVPQEYKYQKGCSSLTRSCHHWRHHKIWMDDVAAPSLQSWPCICLVLWKTACKRMMCYCRMNALCQQLRRKYRNMNTCSR